MVNEIFAQTTQAQPVSPLSGLMPLILIFAIFYFLLIRPQIRRDKEHKKLIANLKKGDQVITTGGIFGTIVNVKPDTVELKISENTKIQLLKSCISQVIVEKTTEEKNTK